MINATLSLLAIFVVLISTEWVWKKYKISSEVSRKIIHTSVAVFTAFWPIYMSFHYIELIALAFLVVLIVVRYLHVFKSIYSVKRHTIGDLLFPVTIFILAALEPSKVVFSIAILFMGLADSLAAVMGKYFGKTNSYKILGQSKSVIGTFAFYLSAMAILVAARNIDPNPIKHLDLLVIVLLPLVTAFAENISPFGTDNLVVPLIVLSTFRWF